MKEYRLDFGRFIHHANGVLEAIIDEGYEITESMIREYFDLVKQIEPKVTACLINRKNNYSYSFEANVMLSSADIVDYVAVINYGKLPWPMKGMLMPENYELEFFNDYDAGMNWLEAKINN